MTDPQASAQSLEHRPAAEAEGAPGHPHKAVGTDFLDCQDLSPDTAVPD